MTRPPPTDLGDGLHGWLEAPGESAVAPAGTLAVRGWVFADTDRVVRVLARTAAGESAAAFPSPRPDVAAAFPGRAEAARSGFEASVPARAGASLLEVFAVRESGRRVRLFERPVFVAGGPGAGPGRFVKAAAGKAWRAWREGRLAADPREWATHLRNLRRELGEDGARAPPPAPAVPCDVRAALTSLYTGVLEDFLASGARLRFEPASEPVVSVLLVLYNRAELTLRCLRSLAETRLPLEIVIVDNASTDRTGALLDRVDGAVVLRQTENTGFLLGTNRAASAARGRHLLLVNSDVELLPGSLEAALRALGSAPDVGAVVGRLVLPDGKLQEAGSIVWNDGSCAGYGRGDDPRAPPYLFRREVDYGSGALLLTPRAVWRALGGFDTAFAPAYYEDADYCARLWESGRRVLYEPRAAALHFEFASSPSRARAVAMQEERRGLFFRRHQAWLAGKLPPRPANLLRARSARPAPRVLVLDDRVPRPDLGAGFPRALQLLGALERLGWQVSLCPLSQPEEAPERVYDHVPPGVEVLVGRGAAGLAGLLEERRGFFDCALASRPHNMQRLAAALERLAPDARLPVVYDAEALFAEREIAARRLRGEAVPEAEAAALRAQETSLAQGARAVLCVTGTERAAFEGAGVPAFVAGHALEPAPTPTGFEERAGLLFVGSLRDASSPNADALRWFVREVLPAVHRELGEPVPLRVVGMAGGPMARLASPHVQLLGAVADLRAEYERARVFVAPTRFAAGLPYKVHHAAAHGVPVVLTPVLAAQLGWEPGREALVAAEPEGFAREVARLYRDAELWGKVRAAALAAVARDCSPAAFDAALARALETIGPRVERERARG